MSEAWEQMAWNWTGKRARGDPKSSWAFAMSQALLCLTCINFWNLHNSPKSRNHPFNRQGYGNRYGEVKSSLARLMSVWTRVPALLEPVVFHAALVGLYNRECKGNEEGTAEWAGEARSGMWEGESAAAKASAFPGRGSDPHLPSAPCFSSDRVLQGPLWPPGGRKSSLSPTYSPWEEKCPSSSTT